MVGVDEELEAAKAASVSQVLFRSARLLNDAGMDRVQLQYPGARRAHSQLFPHLDSTGVRLTELARTLGISKQAVAPLVNELEAMGMVERVPDPNDGRARLIRYSTRGQQGLLHGLATLRSLEAELAGEVGAERMARLHADLTVLLRVLERRREPTLDP